MRLDRDREGPEQHKEVTLWVDVRGSLRASPLEKIPWTQTLSSLASISLGLHKNSYAVSHRGGGRSRLSDIFMYT